MRGLSILFLSGVLVLGACDGGDSDGEDSGAGGADGSGGTSGSTGGASTGGRGSLEVTFNDLPGKIRFANFFSEGEGGVDVDIWWGTTTNRGEFLATVEYGEITDFQTPRRAEDALGDEDEAAFIILRKGDTEFGDIIGSQDPNFDEDSLYTLGIATSGRPTGTTAVMSTSLFSEHELSTPPAGSAHVYSWTSAWDPIPDGDFPIIGTQSECMLERGEVTGGNLGSPVLVPDGTDDVTLFDANTECASGVEPTEGTVEAGKSYVIIGEAETFEIEARTTRLLELGVE